MFTPEKRKEVEGKVIDLFSDFGIDFNTQDTDQTPRRFVDLWDRLTKGYKDPDFEFTMFDNVDEKLNAIIVENNIPYISTCSHHFVPFFGEIAIGYLPKKKIVGLSKLARTVEWIASKPCLQENLTQEIADYIYNKLEPHGVIVISTGRHFCLELKTGKQAVTASYSCIRGVIDKNEVLQILHLNKR